jgi:hypothetical protein
MEARRKEGLTRRNLLLVKFESRMRASSLNQLGMWNSGLAPHKPAARTTPTRRMTIAATRLIGDCEFVLCIASLISSY